MKVIYSATGEDWKGEPINGIAHPRNIGELWSDVELADIGLERFVSPEIEPALPTRQEMQRRVINERDRRLALGFQYDFQDARGVHQIGTTPGDMNGWREVIDYANALIDSGDTTTLIDIVSDTGPAQVTAPEWQAVMLQAATVRQTLWAKSFALQAMDPIPEGFANDSYWT